MAIQDLPRLRAFVDWDGDGWINKGLATDPRNLITNPLTMKGYAPIAVGSGVLLGVPKYGKSARGLYYWNSDETMTFGYNKGSAGVYNAMFTPTATGTYTLQFYALAGSVAAGSTNVTVRNVYPSPENTANITQVATTLSIPVLNTWTLITHTFTVTNITNMRIGIKFTDVGSAAPKSFTGFQIMAGTWVSEVPFNVGTNLSKYDNLEPYIMSAQWQLGMSAPFDTFPSEGTATITLDNTAKTFSVEHTSSPLYSYTVGTDVNFPSGHYPYSFPEPLSSDGATLSIEVQDATSLAWTEMWRGAVNLLTIGTGTSGPTATLTANQGMFRLDKYTISVSILKALLLPGQLYTPTVLVQNILRNFAIVPKMPIMAAANSTTGDMTNKYCVMNGSNFVATSFTADKYIYVDQMPDIVTYTSDVISALNGVTTAAALKDISVSEQSLFFLLRDGSCRWMYRDNIYTNTSSALPYEVPADLVWDDLNSTNADSYAMMPPAVNNVSVEYFPQQNVSGEIFVTKTPIVVLPRQTLTTTVKFQYPEGSKVAVTAINAFNATVLPSVAVAKNVAGVVYAKQSFAIRVVLRNNEADITIQNFLSSSIYMTVTLNGTSVVTNSPMTVHKTAIRGFSALGSQPQTYSSKLFTTRDQADGLASHLLALLGKRYTSFGSVTISSRNAAWLTRILGATLGQRIKYKETTTTGGVYHRVMIVGENASWTPGILTMTYTLRPADNYPFLNTDLTYYPLGGVVY